jgi:hypothetical protein
MALLKLHGMMAAGAAAVALTAGGTAAGMAIAAGPVDSAGVVHGCYAPQGNKGSYQLKLQNAGTNCPKGFTAITWNQKGPQGPAGAPGATGPQGPAGPGLVFATASGANGPATATSGTYFIDVQMEPFNNTGAFATLECNVAVTDPTMPPGTPTPVFYGSYQALADTSPVVTLSGMAPLTAGAPLTVQCTNLNSGQAAPIQAATWYVAPVQTTG